jgi:hypothetical protein
VSFAATVTPLPPGIGVPAGSVQFRIDNTDYGAPLALSGGSATSPTTTTLSVGMHSVQALYLGPDTLRFNTSVSPLLTQTVQPSEPTIVAVRDVRNDQGGRVFVTWHFTLDQPGIQIVTGYRVWRRVPSLVAVAGPSSPTGVDSAGVRSRPTLRRVRTALADSSVKETFWEAIADLPAAQLVSYGYTAPTTQDSIAGSNPYTAFFVEALTADSFVFFDSAPDSGYSVDNLAPPMPSPFTASYAPTSATLHWGSSPAPDFLEFRLYRGSTAQFVPGPSSLIAATRDTGFVDGQAGASFYKLAALDIHGNQSRFAMVSPEAPVSVLASLVSVDAQPDRVRLTWFAAGNSALTAIVYRRTADADWTAVGEITADATGYLHYDDVSVRVGTRYGYRLGIVDGGVEVYAGEVWVTPERLTFTLTGARPNPTMAGNLTVDFTLPTSEPARLELLDIAGRRILVREVGSLGLGHHAVRISQSGRIPPAVYLIRLRQGRDVRVTRVAVLN